VRILGFEWDEVNRDKLAAHDLEADDVQWLFELGDPDIFDHPTHRGRRIALGFVPDDRFVLVSFEYDKKTRWVRVVTAHEAKHERWWEIYAKAKKLDP